MPISNDSKLALQREVSAINNQIDEVEARIRETKQKRDPLNDIIQKLQDEKAVLQAKKQAILTDIP